MRDWQISPLSKLADIRISNVDKKSKPGEKRVRLCNYMDVYSNDYITGELEFMESTANSVEQAKFRVEEGDVMITKDSETPYDIGIPAVASQEFKDLICGYHLALIKPDENVIDPVFLAKQLGSSDIASYFSRVAAGSTRYGLSNGAIARTMISFPALSKQRKISTILQTVDQTIEKTEALIEKYQQIKAGLMHDLFTRGIGADGKLRPPREQAPELYQETPIGWIPKEWGWDTIETCKESLVDGPFGSNLKTEHYVADPGIRVVRLQNIQATKYNDQDKAFVSDAHANSLVRNKVAGNDILIAGLGEDRYPVGRACVYPSDLPLAINKADCFRLRCKDGVMENGFVMYFLNTSAARFQVRKYEQGVTRPRINLGNMNKLVVPRLEINEQNAICLKLSSLERRIESEILQSHKLLKQKSGLMRDLLTGDKQVTVGQPEADYV